MAMRFSSPASRRQAAVVKVASFGGGGRLRAMLDYVSRHGAIVVENERGQALRGPSQLAAMTGEWGPVLRHRSATRDIGTFEFSIQNPPRRDKEEWVRSFVKQALGQRSFAFGLTEGATGEVTVQGVMVLRSRSGERLAGDQKATDSIQRRMVQDWPAEEITFRFTGHGNGTDFGSRHLRNLVRLCDGKVWNEDGRLIAGVTSAGQLVQREWRGQLHSRKSRDVMHLVLSARAGTDSSAFLKAGRAFLAAQFAGHRYAFSLHDPSSDPKAEADGGRRPHVHLHAIVSLRSDSGDRLATTTSIFRQWRIAMANEARSYGIDMDMTQRDRAKAPVYPRTRLRPLNPLGGTHPPGTRTVAEPGYQEKPLNVVDTVSAHASKAGRFVTLQTGQHLEPPSGRDCRRWAADQIAHPLTRGSINWRCGPQQSGMDILRTREDTIGAPINTDAAPLLLAQLAIRPQHRTYLQSAADAAREHLELRRQLISVLALRQRMANGRDARGQGEETVDSGPFRPRQEPNIQSPPDVKLAEQAHVNQDAGARPHQDRSLSSERSGHRDTELAKILQGRGLARSLQSLRRETSHDDRER
ncbi:MAG: hypothetical protein KJ947_21735 [Alphaproteobacteria bacterium]|nr:hypothetical protein [Alphaproteobacteria bacterium]MBU1552169.1 hypothetical protein [Alphaproteobacteria bacterium]MBU2336921.1 hypothetical protein [Alphaproteobacteria bacterium]MBU2389678.1 hypothetical protein [Alphaproteobacteria bacterium]